MSTETTPTVDFLRFGAGDKFSSEAILPYLSNLPGNFMNPIPDALAWDNNKSNLAFKTLSEPFIHAFVELSNCPEVQKGAYKVWLEKKLNGEMGPKRIKALAYLGILFKEFLTIFARLEFERATFLRFEALEEEGRQLRNRLDRAGL